MATTTAVPPLLLLMLLWAAQDQVAGERSFTIDYSHSTFLKDGVPFRLVSGSIHYFRVHPTDWTDRLRKLRYAGFNAVQTYIEWASHEPEPGVYDFTGFNNFTEFILKAQEEDLLVILRPGPYIDAERDMGGFPYWLLREDPDIILRTMDPTYVHYVDAWFGNVLLPMVRPLLYSNGGPVAMVQVENEYGSAQGCDYEYTSHLRDLYRERLGDDALLFSTDGDQTYYLKCGKIPEVYATVDFGTGENITAAFEAQRLFEPRGPLVNSEFYPGWFDHWGVPHSTLPSEAVTSQLDGILAENASVNIYLFHGGSSFGLTAGSHKQASFQSCTQSYDYDAPLSEAGDLTAKYWAVRDVVGKYVPLPPSPLPTNSSKSAYGDVKLNSMAHLLDLADSQQPVLSEDPLTFEKLNLSKGIVVYETNITQATTDPTLLSFKSINDRGYVYLDGVLVGLLAREQKAFQLPVFARPGQSLTVVVESQGRICVGYNINDFKGIIGEVKLGSQILKNWSNTPLPLADLTKLQPSLRILSNSISTLTRDDGELMFYSGTLAIPQKSGHPQDTFLRLPGWTKGVAWINDFCLGRYWPAMGPQLTLYIPHGLLRTSENTITLLELEGAPCGNTAENCVVSFTDKPEIDGPTPAKPLSGHQ